MNQICKLHYIIGWREFKFDWWNIKHSVSIKHSIKAKWLYAYHWIWTKNRSINYNKYFVIIIGIAFSLSTIWSWVVVQDSDWFVALDDVLDHTLASVLGEAVITSKLSAFDWIKIVSFGIFQQFLKILMYYLPISSLEKLFHYLKYELVLILMRPFRFSERTTWL